MQLGCFTTKVNSDEVLMKICHPKIFCWFLVIVLSVCLLSLLMSRKSKEVFHCLTGLLSDVTCHLARNVLSFEIWAFAQLNIGHIN